MDIDGVSMKARSLLRQAGLSRVSRPALIGMAILGILLLVMCAWQFWPRPNTEFIATQAPAAQESSNQSTSTSASREAAGPIVVDVEGAVMSPGLYTLDDGARIGDAVEAAGGFSADAACGTVNLAQKLSDGEQVRISSQQELESASNGMAAGSDMPNAPSSASGKININTASADELQELSGVGPSLSERIIDYREANGRFSSIEDLQNVSGIGEVRFANIKDRICV